MSRMKEKPTDAKRTSEKLTGAKRTRERLSGVFAPVVTPFDGDEVRLDWLGSNLSKLAQTELRGYLALGSNGEFRSLTESEEMKVLEVFAAQKADKVVMVGTACESTRQTIEKTKRAAEMGFPFASILTPHYFARQMNDEIFSGYYRRIADSSPIPILLYNAPGFAGGVSLSAGCVLALAEHGNIVGIKDSSQAGPGGLLAELGRSCEFCVLAGSANFFYPSLLLGAVGGVLSLANSLPGLCCELYRLYLEGSYERALELNRGIVRINRAVSGRFGVAGVKAAMDIAGFQGGEPRHPLKSLSEAERESVRNTIEQQGVKVGQ
jgi:4-hydroxy-2-oxoglutarate aldolase